MKTLFLFIFLFSLSGLSNSKQAVTVTDALVYLPIKDSDVTAGYATFKNESPKGVKVVFHSVAPFTKVEIHETVEKGGLSTMRKINDLLIPGDGRVVFKPGSFHMMLFNPTRALRAGEELTARISCDGHLLKIKFKVVER